MKKLISIFSFISIITVSSINTIACNSSNNSNDLKYEIDEKGKITYNFKKNELYIFGYTKASEVYEIQIFLDRIPLSKNLGAIPNWGRMLFLEINNNQAWVSEESERLLYLKKGKINDGSM